MASEDSQDGSGPRLDLTRIVAGTFADVVGDVAVATVVDRLRGIRDADSLVRAGGWRPEAVRPSLMGWRVAVVGEGEEFSSTARRFRAMGAELVPLPGSGQAPVGLGCVVVLPSGLAGWQRQGEGSAELIVEVSVTGDGVVATSAMSEDRRLVKFPLAPGR